MQWLGNIPLDICNPSYQHHLTELLVRAEVVVVQVLSLQTTEMSPVTHSQNTLRCTDTQDHSQEQQPWAAVFLVKIRQKIVAIWTNLTGCLHRSCILNLADIASTLVKTFLVINNHHTIQLFYIFFILMV